MTGRAVVAGVDVSGEVRLFGEQETDSSRRILHFTVLCLVAKPLNRSEARVDFVVIQTLLLFICKSLCYHAN